MSSRPAATVTWATAWVKTSPLIVAGGLGHRRQRRVLLDRHGQQGEPGGATGHVDLAALGHDVDRLARAGCGRCRTAAARRPAPGRPRSRRPARSPGPRPRSRTPTGSACPRRRPRAAPRRAPGTGGRLGRPRAAQLTASASASRSTWNFTCHRPSDRTLTRRRQRSPDDRASRGPRADPCQRGDDSIRHRHERYVATVRVQVRPEPPRQSIGWTFSGDIIIEERVIVFFGGVDAVDNRRRRRSGAGAACGRAGGNRASVRGLRWTRPTAVHPRTQTVHRASPAGPRPSTGCPQGRWITARCRSTSSTALSTMCVRSVTSRKHAGARRCGRLSVAAA